MVPIFGKEIVPERLEFGGVIGLRFEPRSNFGRHVRHLLTVGLDVELGIVELGHEQGGAQKIDLGLAAVEGLEQLRLQVLPMHEGGQTADTLRFLLEMTRVLVQGVAAGGAFLLQLRQ